jgi:hypothetical protein
MWKDLRKFYKLTRVFENLLKNKNVSASSRFIKGCPTNSSDHSFFKKPGLPYIEIKKAP